MAGENFGVFINGASSRTLDGTELVPVVVSSVTEQATMNAISSFANSTGLKTGSTGSSQLQITTTGFHDMTGISLAVAANEKWCMDINLYLSAALATGGIKVRMNGPSSPSFFGWTIIQSNSNTTTALCEMARGTVFPFTTTNAVGAGGDAQCRIQVHFVNGVNAGTLQLQWSIQVADATGGFVLPEGYFKAFKF